MNAATRRPAVPRHRPEPPDRDRVDDGHELRQAGPPPPRVPERARPAVAGRGRVAFDGEAYRVHAGVVVPDSAPFPIVVAALGPQMLKVTAELADGTLTWCTGPATLAEHTIPTINAAAEAAGRPAPRVIAALPCASRRRRPAPASGPPRSSPSTASCRATGRCSTARARPGRRTSPSSARPTRSPTASRALADIGVTDFAAVEFGGDPDEVDGDEGGPRRYARRLMGGGRSGRRCLGLVVTASLRRPGPASAPRRRCSDRAAGHDARRRRRVDRWPVRRPCDWSVVSGRPPSLTMEWECASVDVPLDHADPTGETISRRPHAAPCSTPATTAGPLVARTRAARARPASSWPGSSSTCCRRAARRVLPRRLGPARRRPLDAADRLRPVRRRPTCPIADDVQRRHRASCSPRSARPTRPSTSRQVRVALGVERLDYLGFSYGTALGAVYAMAHPDRVGRFVLDGAIDPTPAIPTGRSPPTACRTTPPTSSTTSSPASTSCATPTAECAAGPDSAALVDELGTTIGDAADGRLRR